MYYDITMKGKIWKRTMQVIGALIIGVMALFSVKANQSHEMQVESTLSENKLGLCPKKPNCVSSFQESSDEHYTAPLEIDNLDMAKIDEHFKSCAIKSETDNYRHYTCESNLFKFVDDVEILRHDGKLWFRSASRVGYSDMGANLKRINALKTKLTKVQ